jgi:hypothetical protein
MSNRTIKGITDALLNTEEVVGMIDYPDRAYRRGLRIGSRVIEAITQQGERERFMARQRQWRAELK